MYLTEQEIMDQSNALVKTLAQMSAQKQEIEAFFQSHSQRKFVLLGCGSSFMLAKSGQHLFSACADTAAIALTGGEYLINPSAYAQMLKNSIVVTLSRSGKTTEIVRAVRHIKETLGCPIISLSMQEDNDVMPMSELDVTMSWCYDKSVCQTRTVTNLYAALTLLAAYYSHDEELERSVAAAVQANEAYIQQARPVLETVGAMDWNNAVVLADGAVTGLAEEGALAFTEIAMLHGRCFHVLDYRHGPIVLNDRQTLTIVLVQPSANRLQLDLLEDLKTHGGTVVTVGEGGGNPFDVTAHIQIAGIERFEAWGIPFIFTMQMTSYIKALQLGNNPDQPKGLDPFIVLK